MLEGDFRDEDPAPYEFDISEFGEWTTCSTTCGTGVKSRTRTIKSGAAYGGKGCSALKESSSCHEMTCPVDCEVSMWKQWSACSLTCGDGVATRKRSISVSPAFGGKASDLASESSHFVLLVRRRG